MIGYGTPANLAHNGLLQQDKFGELGVCDGGFTNLNGQA